MMRYRFLLLASWILSASANAQLSLDPLPRPVDEIIVNTMTEPIQPSDLEVLVLMQPGQCAPSADSKPANNDVLIRWFACAAFTRAVADGKATLPLRTKELNSTQQPEDTVLAAARPLLTGRRYVAMIMWDVTFQAQVTAHCNPCSYILQVPMEIVVMDTEKGEKVWQSHHVSQVRYTDHHFDATRARMLGVNGMQRLVNVVLSQRQLLATEQAGLRRTRGFLMQGPRTKSPELNPDARLIIVNNDHFNRTSLEKRYTVLLTALSPQQQTKALYTIPLHGFVALNLPAGKYSLQVSKETTHQFEIGDQPAYLMVKSPQWNDSQEVRAITAEDVRSLSLDLVNALIPEKTPASYQSKGHSLYWSRP